MSNLILLLLFALITYVIFFIEKDALILDFSEISFFNETFENGDETKNRDLFKTAPGKTSIATITEEVLVSNPKMVQTVIPTIENSKIKALRQELNINLMHLEYTISFEDQLADLASKDRVSLERLQEYAVAKQELQLKIIELTQTISYYQSEKINLC
ncbi:hypothetical protein [Mariniflexile sp. AS56]|uniref:hypothetical protein n=1 Tax=Mariniflexile sp. AS56 TaxID=3063957 RepID=UPI0026EC2BB2|nr:hypothetical protein [Mariniflexile sp. AS56]MDO7171526.1 hypothetical protein [Mariniflexile sp. AS56]